MNTDQKFACAMSCIIGIAATLLGSFLVGGILVFGWFLLGFGVLTIIICAITWLDSGMDTANDPACSRKTVAEANAMIVSAGNRSTAYHCAGVWWEAIERGDFV